MRKDLLGNRGLGCELRGTHKEMRARGTKSTGRRDSFLCHESEPWAQACTAAPPEWLHVALFPQHQALHSGGAAGRGIAFDEQGAHPGISACRLEFSRHAAEKSLQNKLFLHTDHAVIGPTHPHIGLVGGAVW